MSAAMMSTAGQALGGPFGAVAGAMVGGMMGAALSRPRAGAEAVLSQRSAYGAIVPALFGRCRVGGLLLWATPVQRLGGGKAGGQRSYVISFAVAVSTRPVWAIGRIWADGREIRNAAGELNVPVTVRLRRAGSAVADAAMVAAEGVAGTPAYAGHSLVVFSDMDIGSFGNRIPVVEIELFADAPDLGLGAWMAEAAALAGLSADVVAGAGVEGVKFAADTLGDDIGRLSQLGGCALRESGGRLGFAAAGGTHVIALADIVSVDGNSLVGRGLAVDDGGGATVIGFCDPDRELLESEQSARGGAAGAGRFMDAAATMRADVARSLAQRIDRERQAGRDVLRLALPWARLDVAVGDLLSLEGQPGVWRVMGRRIEGFAVHLECRRAPATPATGAVEGDGGRSLDATLAGGHLDGLSIFEFPTTPWALADSPSLFVAAAADSFWAGGEILLDDGAVDRIAGRLKRGLLRAVLVEPLSAGPSTVWDEASALVVDLDHVSGWIESRDEAAVLAGANMLRVGEELLQFRDAVPMGDGRYRLSGLLRGRGVTAIPADGHAAGAICWLLHPDGLAALPYSDEMVGRSISVALAGAGVAAEGLVQDHEILGLASAPLGPCHIRGERLADDAISVSWIERGRAWMSWSIDDSGEAQGLYRCVLEPLSGGRVERIVRGNGLELSAGEQVSLFGGPLREAAVQLFAEGSGPAWLRGSAIAHLSF